MRSAYLISFLLPAALAQYYGGGDMATTTSAAASPSHSAHSGADRDVQVGAGGKFVFEPDTLNPKVGEKITFWFNPSNHTVTQSSFDKPCVPLSDSAINSGFQPVSQGQGSQVFTITVNDTKPIWLYCAQGKHCQGGMVMVINPASGSPNTLTAYKAAAAGVAKSEAAPQVGGGELGPANASPSSSGSSPSSTGAPKSTNAAWAAKATDLTPLAIAGGLVLALL